MPKSRNWHIIWIFIIFGNALSMSAGFIIYSLVVSVRTSWFSMTPSFKYAAAALVRINLVYSSKFVVNVNEGFLSPRSFVREREIEMRRREMRKRRGRGRGREDSISFILLPLRKLRTWRTRPSRPMRCDMWIVEWMRYPTNQPTNRRTEPIIEMRGRI